MNNAFHTHSVDQTTNILNHLRELEPINLLDRKSHQVNSELQANMLRKMLGAKDPIFPDEAITNLENIELVLSKDLPYSASAQWIDKHWIITLNSNESKLRRRFSLAHEVKHIVDHSNKRYLYLDNTGITHNRMAEHQADYFAACLLMPRDQVLKLYNKGYTTPTELAKHFQVSPRAMHVRMKQLKLTTRWQRCKYKLRHRIFVLRLIVKIWNTLPLPSEVKL
jgi:Zn-dependent peptidase ImmA (M78 family)